MSRWLLIAVVAFLSACGFDIEDGDYDFRQVALERADCALDPPVPERWVGSLRLRGETVTIDLPEAAFRFARGPRALVGHFQPDQDRNRFLADSNFDILAGIEGRSCLVFTHLQIGATIHGGDSFEGTLQIVDSRQLEAALGCPFACVTTIQFKASKR